MPPLSGRATTWLGSVSLLLLVLIAYSQAPANGFHFDDRINITEHPPARLSELSLTGLLEAGTEARLANRPLPGVSFAVDWWRGGGSPAPFQWTNVLLHAANAVLVSLLLARLLDRWNASSPRRSRVAALAGDPVTARQLFRQALDADPEYAMAHSNLGASLMIAGDYAAARAHLERALSLSPGHAEARANLARLERLERGVRR